MNETLIRDLIRYDLPRLKGNLSLRGAADLLIEYGLEHKNFHNPTGIVESAGDGSFFGLLSLMDLLRRILHEDENPQEETPRTKIEEITPALNDGLVIEVRESLQGILQKISDSPSGGCPVMEGSVFKGVILGEDLFSRIAETVLLSDGGFGQDDQA